ncbi:MAG: cyclodeaminase/cyclohydrolase family protein [Eubacteriales bacterium]|nr:cyclodeaminase/cyclohydrolase family protein [Eubacteriales bacterium]
MKLVELNVTDFVNEMGSSSPAPGGGSASALAGSQAAGLLRMVALLTIGKKKYADVQDFAAEVEEKAHRLMDEFTDIIDRDTESFNAVSAVFAMPKETDEDKAARKAAMQEALKGCTVTPLEMMKLSLEGLEIVETAAGKLNASAMSDLGCSVLQFEACLKGAWLNVLINAGGIEDEAFTASLRAEAGEILEKAQKLASELYVKIEALI